ncbi:MAG: hypothetical protein IJM59_10880 [Proteobacteria bacterium]|nr:hypothetical protein [Pseudomonadota bacterium]
MKLKSLFVLFITCFLTGCSMESVVDWGADCPPSQQEGKLKYIGDISCNAEHTSCVIADPDGQARTYDFSKNFEIHRCPSEFPKCVQDEEEGDFYCEAQKTCADGYFSCDLDNGKTICVDPAASTTCGADESKCSEPNHGGQNCNEFGMSTCVQRDGKYFCQCASGSKLCGSYCLNPSLNETCGANDCNAPNYGGDDCTEYSDVRECRANDEGIYSCQCRKGDILCDGKCITPSSDPSFCGAKGDCTGTDPDDENYKGLDCDSGSGKCTSGLCTCSSDQIWCIPEGSEIPQCVSPNEDQTCGAHLIENTNECEIMPCAPGQSCTFRDNEYQCIQTKCPDSDMQLCTIDGTPQCISKHDPMNCGVCGMKCETYKAVHAHGSDCQKNDSGDYECTFACDAGYTDCNESDPFHPECVDLMLDLDNCGSCGNVCKKGELCENGVCTKSNCKPNQCETTDANGIVICLNDENHCGQKCDNCQSLTDHKCDTEIGKCVPGGCKSNQHPIYSGTRLTGCEDNSISKCAPPTRKADEPIEDCNAKKPGYATSMACSEQGECIVLVCSGNNHIAKDKKSCVPNTPQACGSGNSTSTKSCIVSPIAAAECSNGNCNVTNCIAGYHIKNNICEKNSSAQCGPTNGTPKSCISSNVAEAQCSADGKSCIVTKCATGYHINSKEKTACVANSNTNCAPTDSYSTTDCTQTFKKTCSEAGSCKCSSGVVNYDKNACVHKACKDIPGVKEGKVIKTSWYDKSYSEYACNAVKCNSNYKRQKQDKKDAAVCLPLDSKLHCIRDMGYKYKNSDGYCVGRKNGNGGNGHAHCKDGYRQYIFACLPKDVCCGTRNTNMSKSTDFLCTNCKAQGKTCNLSTGKCK